MRSSYSRVTGVSSINSAHPWIASRVNETETEDRSQLTSRTHLGEINTFLPGNRAEPGGGWNPPGETEVNAWAGIDNNQPKPPHGLIYKIMDK